VRGKKSEKNKQTRHNNNGVAVFRSSWAFLSFFLPPRLVVGVGVWSLVSFGWSGLFLFFLPFLVLVVMGLLLLSSLLSTHRHKIVVRYNKITVLSLAFIFLILVAAPGSLSSSSHVPKITTTIRLLPKFKGASLSPRNASIGPCPCCFVAGFPLSFCLSSHTLKSPKQKKRTVPCGLVSRRGVVV
jgi:hypothetical protein